MKKMGEAEGLTGVRDDDADADATVYKYWLKATVEGSLVKEIHGTVLRESAKKANFPGFRKGQVPPFAMGQIRGFAVQESIVRTCQSAVDAYGLKSVSGSDGEVEILEDIPEVSRGYKLGDALEFTAFLNAQVDPEAQPPAVEESDDAEESSSSSEDGVIDAEAVASE
jgi:FKBP-type peptidyl-prolyl cis-trans isomerase (trigger factor)